MRDIWRTKDDYHVQDVFDLGRCVICGSLANGEKIKGNYNERYPACTDLDCRGQILSTLAELAAR